MLIPALALITLSVVRGGEAEVAIMGPDNVEVPLGGEAILLCKVEQPYKFCSFINPAGATLSLDPHINHEEGRISLAGLEELKKTCGVRISPILEADLGVWRCKVTVVVEGNPQVGRSRVNVTVLKPKSPDIGVKLNQREEGGRGQMEASTNATVLYPDHSEIKNDIGDQMEDVEEQLANLANQTKSNDLENEETTIVSSTTIAFEFNQATSSAPLVVYEVNPSAENSDEQFLKEAVSKLKPLMEEALEESKKEGSTDLSEEQVVVVTIIAIMIMMIVVVIFITIAKIKKLLCFREIDGDGEDEEKSAFADVFNREGSKSSQKSENSTYDEVKEGNNP